LKTVAAFLCTAAAEQPNEKPLPLNLLIKPFISTLSAEKFAFLARISAKGLTALLRRNPQASQKVIKNLMASALENKAQSAAKTFRNLKELGSVEGFTKKYEGVRAFAAQVF